MAFDFLSDIGSIANPFGVPSKGQWNLVRGVYTSSEGEEIVLFFEVRKGEDPSQRTAIDQIGDTGGKRLAVYEYPYVPGQRLANLGRKGETYTFNIKFHGLNYQEKFQDFIDIVVNDTSTGTLLHPVLSAVRGALKVQLRDYEFIHRYDEWNAVTIKAVFVEDNTGEIELINLPQANQDSALRSGLQTLTNVQAAIGNTIFEVGALLNLPSAILNAMKQRLDSITGQTSRLLGQLAVTFSSNATIKSLAAQSQNLSGGIPALSSGTVTSSSTGTTVLAQLPPVYQVGFDPTTQESITSQIDSYVNANQVTPQQAVFSANQARQAITAAINEVDNIFGNDGYDIVIQYRNLAISIQQSVESSLASSQQLVKVYTLQTPMSLRMVANVNGLDPNKQNDLESLNPYLPSLNYLPTGTQVTVPIA